MLKILISYNLLITKLFGNVFLERLWLPPVKRHFLHGCFCNCYVQMASQRQTFHKCCWSPVYSSHITFVVCLPCMLMLPLCFVGLFLSISVITVTVVFKQGPQRVWWESATASWRYSATSSIVLVEHCYWTSVAVPQCSLHFVTFCKNIFVQNSTLNT